MLIIYGLSNNEKRYFSTKHNIGRIVIENILKKLNLNLKEERTYYYTKSKIGQSEVVFLLSKGYMNDSGRPLNDFLDYYKISHENLRILLVQDDSDQYSGSSKIVNKGRSAGHRGIDSVSSYLLGSNYSSELIWRLKLGIRPLNNRQQSINFVLSPISKEDEDLANNSSELVCKNLDKIEKMTIEAAQNIFNYSLSS
jgi:PTH1 family peptidyl-tRNA hydrolase